MARGTHVYDGAWPLVGRDDELAFIDTAYAEANGVVLVGEAGVGKTRLARQALLRPPVQGAPTAWAAASRSAAAAPLGALAHLLLSGERPASGPVDALELLVARFAERRGGRPVLAVDDAHLLDDASAAVAHQLAAGGHAFVMITVRANEPAPDAVTALWTDEVAPRLDVPLLSGEHVGTLLGAALGGRVDAVSDMELRRICRGNPLLLREIVRAGRETGALHHTGGGIWQWTGGDYVTHRLTDVVGDAVGTLEPGLRALAELLAWAERLPLPMLESLTNHAAVVAAERGRLISVERSRARLVAQLAYPVYGDVVRARTPRSREREIWRSLAEAIGRTPMRRRDDTLLAVRWRHRAGLPVAPDLLLAAAHRAHERLDFDAAERFARLAATPAANTNTNTKTNTSATAAELLLTEVLLDQGRYADAAAALPSQPAGLDENLRAGWAVTRDRIGYWSGGQDGGQSDSQDSRGSAGSPSTPDGSGPGGSAPGGSAPGGSAPGGSAPGGSGPGGSGGSPEPAPADGRTDAARSWFLLLDGNTTEAARLSAVAGAAPGVPAAAANWATAAAVASAGLLGRHEQAMAALGAGLATADRHRHAHPWGGLQVGGAGCVALLAAGRLRDAVELADSRHRAAIDTAVAIGPDAAPLVGAWTALRGVIARAQGRATRAVTELTEAVALLDGRPTLLLGAAYLAELAAAHALAGEVDAATDRLAEAERGPSPGPLFEAWVERARAWVTAAGGDLTLAVAQALRASTLARRTGQPTIEALALFDAARFGGADPAQPRLTGLAGDVEGPAVPAMAAIATALRSRQTGAVLDRAAATLAGLGHLLYAAEAATAAHQQHLRSGRRAQAQASLARAAILVRDCPGARTPLLAPNGLFTALTSRELQVASLAAAGHSAPTIAARLGLSARTVNNYLGRAYDKLGVRGRPQLAGVLTDLAAAPRNLSA